MSEKPILFSAPMVRAILAGAKVQTRRTIKDQTLYRGDGHVWTGFMGWQPFDWALANRTACGNGCLPRWSVGDHLWVRETWGFNPDHPSIPEFACYRADPGHEHDGIRWRPSIHMPRRASRVTLEVTGVRVERLQDITEADAVAEGIYWSKAQDGWCSGRNGCETVDYHAASAVISYSKLWEAINGAGAWDANPWVAAVTFRRIANAGVPGGEPRA